MADLGANRRRISLTLIPLLIPMLLTSSCGQLNTIERRVAPPDRSSLLDAESPYLKAHLLDGRVYVLQRWAIDEEAGSVSGEGKLLGLNRQLLEEGSFTLALDSVALFETNTLQTSRVVSGLTVLTSVSLALTVACITNPKACFGSCPTFYDGDQQDGILHAEGFSASVAPSLEATDVDALFRLKASGPEISLRMTNEALETHVLRWVDLLLLPRSPASRVYAGIDGRYYPAGPGIPPAKARGSEGDCADLLADFDGAERYSAADSFYLGAKEIIDLHFDRRPSGSLGLVVAARQTLLSTHLFYQALAYMGRSAGTWLAALEREQEGGYLKERAGGIGKVLGGIEVLLPDDEGAAVGEISETGPLATDVKVIPLPVAGEGPLDLRLRMTRGHWRMDRVALVALDEPVTPLRVKPRAVTRAGVEDAAALDALLDPERSLSTFPGDEYRLFYRLPGPAADYEPFLESRGYYLEWMRESWFAEEDPQRAAMMFFTPEKALSVLAPEFKAVEADMETLFWGSRYAP